MGVYVFMQYVCIYIGIGVCCLVSETFERERGAHGSCVCIVLPVRECKREGGMGCRNPLRYLRMGPHLSILFAVLPSGGPKGGLPSIHTREGERKRGGR